MYATASAVSNLLQEVLRW